MSFFEDASLVYIPSAVKSGKTYSVKPTDGTGDLTFTRASNATRVDSNGLIEKVRTNLILQSNTFSTTWVNSDSTETSGQAGYDGTNNAWLLNKIDENGQLNQSVSTSGLNTFSVYAKAGTSNFLRLTPYDDSFFDLANGIAYASGPTTISANIVSVGNGWYRCSITYNASSTIVRIIVADSSSSSSGTSGNIYIQNAQLEVGDIATDYIATTSAAVSVGPVSGLPRLDYLNSSCPRLLLEPQRSSLYTFSEQIDNAAWGKTNVSVTANNTASPDGYTNADKVVANTTNGVHRIEQDKATATQVATQSVFAKASGYNFIALENGGEIAYFNISTGVVGTISGGTASVQNYGNGWYRCIFTATALNTKSYIYISNADNSISFAGDNTSGAFIYGAQFEVGAYATSYIPTLSTSVTRVADACSKTGISSLIGQTEGTLFVEVNFNGSGFGTDNDFLVYVGNGSNTNSMYIDYYNNLFRFVIFTGASLTFYDDVATTSGTHKLALAYKSGSYAAYLDGVQIKIDTSAANPPTTSVFSLAGGATGFNAITKNINQALVFKTRLTNAQLAELTTI